MPYAAGRYPILATEFGLSLPKGTTVKDRDCGKAIVTYLEGKGIGRLGRVFDPEWGPNPLQSWDTCELTGGGAFFPPALQGELAN